MDKYEETFDTWNKIASLYNDKFMDLDVYNSTYDFICSSINKPNAIVLDIGCGPGNITKYLLSKRPDFDIHGIDTSPNMIELAQKNNPTAHFTVMDCRQINLLNQSYDGIIVGFCLPYLSTAESKELISNAYDLLNENGLIYLSFVEGNPNNSDFKVGSGGRVYFHYHNLDDLITELTAAKFNQPEIFKVPYKTSETEHDVHTIIVARKK